MFKLLVYLFVVVGKIEMRVRRETDSGERETPTATGRRSVVVAAMEYGRG